MKHAPTKLGMMELRHIKDKCIALEPVRLNLFKSNHAQLGGCAWRQKMLQLQITTRWCKGYGMDHETDNGIGVPNINSNIMIVIQWSQASCKLATIVGRCKYMCTDHHRSTSAQAHPWLCLCFSWKFSEVWGATWSHSRLGGLREGQKCIKRLEMSECLEILQLSASRPQMKIWRNQHKSLTDSVSLMSDSNSLSFAFCTLATWQWGPERRPFYKVLAVSQDVCTIGFSKAHGTPNAKILKMCKPLNKPMQNHSNIFKLLSCHSS